MSWCRRDSFWSWTGGKTNGELLNLVFKNCRLAMKMFPSSIVCRKLVIIEYNCKMIWFPEYLGKSSSDDDSDVSIFQQPE